MLEIEEFAREASFGEASLRAPGASAPAGGPPGLSTQWSAIYIYICIYIYKFFLKIIYIYVSKFM